MNRAGHLSGSLKVDTKKHHFDVRVYFEDTDVGGVVYHSNYLKYAERARTEFMRCLGIPHSTMIDETGAMFAVQSCKIQFLKPAVLDDWLKIETSVIEVTGARAILIQEIFRGEKMITRLHVALACIKKAGQPTRLPQKVFNLFKAFLLQGA